MLGGWGYVCVLKFKFYVNWSFFVQRSNIFFLLYLKLQYELSYVSVVNNGTNAKMDSQVDREGFKCQILF